MAGARGYTGFATVARRTKLAGKAVAVGPAACPLMSAVPANAIDGRCLFRFDATTSNRWLRLSPSAQWRLVCSLGGESNKWGYRQDEYEHYKFVEPHRIPPTLRWHKHRLRRFIQTDRSYRKSRPDLLRGGLQAPPPCTSEEFQAVYVCSSPSFSPPSLRCD
jgi:hypothetical protein